MSVTVVLIPKPMPFRSAFFLASRLGRPLQFDPHRIRALLGPDSSDSWNIRVEIGESKIAFGALLAYPPKNGVFREPRVVDSGTNWILPQESMLSLDSAERRLGRPGIIMAQGTGVLCQLEGLIETERANFTYGPIHAVHNFLQHSAFGLLDANGIPARFPPGSTAFNYSLDKVAWLERAPEGGMKVLSCSFSLELQQYEINAAGRLSDTFILPIEMGMETLGRSLENLGMNGKHLFGAILDAASLARSNFVVVCRDVSERIIQLLSEGGSGGSERGFADAGVFVPVHPTSPTRTGTNARATPQADGFRNIPFRPEDVVVGQESQTYSFRVRQ